MRRQLALLLRMPPCSDSPSSFKRRFRNSHAATPRSISQDFGFGCSAHRKRLRRATGTPLTVAFSRSFSNTLFLSFRKRGSAARLARVGWYPQFDAALPERLVVLLARVLEQF